MLSHHNNHNELNNNANYFKAHHSMKPLFKAATLESIKWFWALILESKQPSLMLGSHAPAHNGPYLAESQAATDKVLD